MIDLAIADPRIDAPTPSAGQPIDDVTLASLLSSRICHDLIGAVGALKNGVEIVTDSTDADFRNHAFQVIADSTGLLEGRLMFYRAAFGHGGRIQDEVQVAELERLSAGYLRGGKVTLDWTAGAVSVDRRVGRLLLNLILVGYEALPRGGVLQVGVAQKGATNLIVMSEGRAARLDERRRGILRTGLEPEGEPLHPKESPLVLTHRLAQMLGAELSFGQEEERVVVSATL